MATPNPAGLSVRYGTDLGDLAEDLVIQLASSPLAVLDAELVVVPTPGIRTWLEERLSRHLGASGAGDGISANIEFQFFDSLLRRVTGRSTQDEDPWSVGHMTFAGIEVLSDAEAGSGIASLRPGAGELGMFETARSAADLFDQLFRWRPDIADAWLDGDEADPRAALLRALNDRIGTSPPHRTLAACVARLARGDDDGLDLPARIHIFGGDALPGGPQLPGFLDALAFVRQVTMHVAVASAARFDAIRSTTPPFGRVAADRTTSDDPVHPLLGTWGALGRETAMLLAQVPERPTTSFTRVADSHDPAATVLGNLQTAVRQRDGGPAAALPPDGTIQFHECVGDLRQVEVLRDALLHALRDDPHLAPRDIVVLCPDLPRFAPLVDAVLGIEQGAPRLPYVLADRSLSRAIPIVAATAQALGLLGGRFPRSGVIDLLRNGALQARFGLSEHDVDRIVDWADAGDVRWGVSGAGRTAAGLPSTFEGGTWIRLLDRLLLGAALPSNVIAPSLGLRALDPGLAIETIGRLSDVVATLAALDDASRRDRSVHAWCDFARDLVGSVFAVSYDDASGLEQLHRCLASIEDDARGVLADISFAEFRAAFNDRVASVRTVVTSGSSGITVTSLAPLRNIPFKVVAILGLDERALLQNASIDLAFGSPRVGDRDPRAETRAALLGAVLGARSRFLVTYEGADVVTNQLVPVSAALAELRDAIDTDVLGGWRAVTRAHPRHGYGAADLDPDGPGLEEPFSFDRDALAWSQEIGQRAVRGGPAARLAATPAAPDAGPIDIGELGDFLAAPQRTFLERSLGVYLPRVDEPPIDELPTGLSALEEWNLTMDLAREARSQLPEAFTDTQWRDFIERWRLEPDSPLATLPGRLAADELEGRSAVGPRALALARRLERVTKGSAAEPLHCEVVLDDGTTVSGDPEVYGGTTVVRYTASTHERAVRLRGSLDLLLLTAHDPAVDWRAVQIVRKGVGAVPSTAAILGDEVQRRAVARASLATLVDLRRRGLSAPVPLFLRVTMKMLAALSANPRLGPEELLVTGFAGWEVYGAVGDKDDPAVRFCFDASYEDLCDLPAESADPKPRGATGGSRMIAYSRAMCEALGAVELEASNKVRP